MTTGRRAATRSLRMIAATVFAGWSMVAAGGEAPASAGDVLARQGDVGFLIAVHLDHVLDAALKREPKEFLALLRREELAAPLRLYIADALIRDEQLSYGDYVLVFGQAYAACAPVSAGAAFECFRACYGMLPPDLDDELIWAKMQEHGWRIPRKRFDRWRASPAVVKGGGHPELPGVLLRFEP
jgi:hypothetical protein